MNRLVIIVALAALALNATGCAKLKGMFHKGDSAAVEGEADTANLDMPVADNVEPVPAVDGSTPVPETAEAMPPAEQAPPADPNIVPQEQPQDQAMTPPPAEAAPAVTEAAPSVSEAAPSVSEAAPSVAGSGVMADYTVQKGDTLMKIAFNVYGDISKWKEIYDVNKDMLRDANVLVPGTQIKYDKPASDPVIEKNGDPYLIKKGDTLGTIADDVYAKPQKWRKLWENNKTLIKDPNRIYAGFYLYYQITEQERQEADQIKASRGQKLGTASAPTDAPIAAPADGTGAGLTNLAAPDSRAPGSAN